MPWSITIGRIAGTAVRIHVTFILFLVWIGASAESASQLFADLNFLVR